MGYARRKERPAEHRDDEHGLDQIDRLYAAITQRSRKGGTESRTAKLFAAGVPKMAQKLVEEAAEVAIEAVRGQRSSLRSESADLLYHLVLLWNALHIAPSDIWDEMRRREHLLGIAEKLPKRLGGS